MQPNEHVDKIKECRFCHVLIREFNYGTGPEWLHLQSPGPGESGPYKICKTYTVATPPETVGEWAEKMIGPKHAKEEQ